MFQGFLQRSKRGTFFGAPDLDLYLQNLGRDDADNDSEWYWYDDLCFYASSSSNFKQVPAHLVQDFSHALREHQARVDGILISDIRLGCSCHGSRFCVLWWLFCPKPRHRQVRPTSSRAWVASQTLGASGIFGQRKGKDMTKFTGMIWRFQGQMKVGKS